MFEGRVFYIRTMIFMVCRILYSCCNLMIDVEVYQRSLKYVKSMEEVKKQHDVLSHAKLVF